MRYVKKAVEIEAEQFTGLNTSKIIDFCNGQAYVHTYSDNLKGHDIIKIRTLEGEMEVSMYDYVIKGVKGEFYPCKPDIFHLTYDLVSSE